MRERDICNNLLGLSQFFLVIQPCHDLDEAVDINTWLMYASKGGLNYEALDNMSWKEKEKYYASFSSFYKKLREK